MVLYGLLKEGEWKDGMGQLELMVGIRVLPEQNSLLVELEGVRCGFAVGH